jgi:hypothetical protein
MINAIKEWMKRHAGQPLPSFSEVCGDIVPKTQLTSYTGCKQKAFRELEKDGFVLKYCNDKRTIAYVDSYNVPEDAGKKVADRLFPDPNEEHDTESKAVSWNTTPKEFPKAEAAAPSLKISKTDKNTEHQNNDQTHLFINQTMEPSEIKGLGRMIFNIARTTKDSLLVKVKITRSQEGI